jgi:hypothetical protein
VRVNSHTFAKAAPGNLNWAFAPDFKANSSRAFVEEALVAPSRGNFSARKSAILTSRSLVRPRFSTFFRAGRRALFYRFMVKHRDESSREDLMTVRLG